MINGINAWVEGVQRYSSDIADWTMRELFSIDERTGEIFEMNRRIRNDA